MRPRLPRFDNPRTARRVATVVLLLGGLLAGLGTAIRAWQPEGNDNRTFLLDTGGLLIALLGAGLDFRASGHFAVFDERGSQRRAMAQLLAGSLAAGIACIALGWLASDEWPAAVRGAIATFLTLGIGVGLAGLLYIGWFSGGDYLERRIEQRSGEEW